MLEKDKFNESTGEIVVGIQMTAATNIMRLWKVLSGWTAPSAPRGWAKGNAQRAFFLLGVAFPLAMGFMATSIEGCPLQEKLPAISNQTCLACHDGRVAPDVRSFTQGAHTGVACEVCHGNGYLHARNPQVGELLISNPGELPFPDSMNVCATCHDQQVDGHLAAPHGAIAGLTCFDCHNVHRANGMVTGPETSEALGNETFQQLCQRCHESQTGGFLASVHAVTEVANCASCHDVHRPGGLALSATDNSLCLQCHTDLGFDTEEAVGIHTGFFHPVDPAGTGASRCTGCHLPPEARSADDSAPHDHSLATIPPSFSNEQMDLGVAPAPPNSCSGVAGCHDPGAETSGAPHNPDSRAQNEVLQQLYDEFIGEIP